MQNIKKELICHLSAAIVGFGIAVLVLVFMLYANNDSGIQNFDYQQQMASTHLKDDTDSSLSTKRSDVTTRKDSNSEITDTPEGAVKEVM